MSSIGENDKLNKVESENVTGKTNTSSAGTNITMKITRTTPNTVVWDVLNKVDTLANDSNKGSLTLGGIKTTSLKKNTNVSSLIENVSPLIENPDNVLSKSLTIRTLKINTDSYISVDKGIHILSTESIHTIFLAPKGTTKFDANGTTITDTINSAGGWIEPPSAPGNYHIYVKDVYGNVSPPSKAVVTVVEIEWYTPIVDDINKKYKAETSDKIKERYTISEDGDTFTINNDTMVGNGWEGRAGGLGIGGVTVSIPFGKTLINQGIACLIPNNYGTIRNHTKRPTDVTNPSYPDESYQMIIPHRSTHTFNSAGATIENNADIIFHNCFPTIDNFGKIINNHGIYVYSDADDFFGLKFVNHSSGEIINDSSGATFTIGTGKDGDKYRQCDFINSGSITNRENAVIIKHGYMENSSVGHINNKGNIFLRDSSAGDLEGLDSRDHRFINYGKITNTGKIEQVSALSSPDSYTNTYQIDSHLISMFSFWNSGEINNTDGEIFIGKWGEDPHGLASRDAETLLAGSFINHSWGGYRPSGMEGWGSNGGGIKGGELTMMVKSVGERSMVNTLDAIVDGTKIYVQTSWFQPPLIPVRTEVSVQYTIPPTSYTTTTKMVPSSYFSELALPGEVKTYEYTLKTDVTINDFLYIPINSTVIIPEGIQLTLNFPMYSLLLDNDGTIINRGRLLLPGRQYVEGLYLGEQYFGGRGRRRKTGGDWGKRTTSRTKV